MSDYWRKTTKRIRSVKLKGMKSMKKLELFEPAMCCSTGVCGPNVDQELLRLSLVFNKLRKIEEIEIERFNLSSSPQVFIDNKTINEIVNDNGIDDLPVTLLNGEVVKLKNYPTNSELAQWLEIDLNIIDQATAKPAMEL